MVRALSIPRPAYIAAHSPAGPAPTMITSYPCLVWSFIHPQLSVGDPQLQSWRPGITGEPPPPPPAKPPRFDFPPRALPTRHRSERRPPPPPPPHPRPPPPPADPA